MCEDAVCEVCVSVLILHGLCVFILSSFMLLPCRLSCDLCPSSLSLPPQIPNAYGVPLAVANTAYEAARAMDRFPVADADSVPLTDQTGEGL